MFSYKSVLDTARKGLPVIRLYLSSTGLLMAGVALQSVGFIILARWLGSEQFGHLSLIAAATNLGGSWCGLGAMDTIRRRGSREPSLYPDLLGHAVILLTASGAVLTAVMTAAIALWTPIVSDPVQNFVIIALLVSSNMVLFMWITLTEVILLTHSQFTRASLFNFSFGLARTLTAILACVVFGVDSLGTWAWWNFAAFVVVSLACVWLLYPYGAPRWRVLWDEIPLGMTFGISGTMAALRQNVDLLALSAVASPQLLGAYGVTRRVLGIALVTGASLDRLLFNKFAIAGKSGPAATLALAKKWILPAIGLTTLTSAAIFVLAPVLPLLFGDGFRDVVWIIRVLCWTLVLTAIQFIAFDAINAADQHRVRVVVTTVVGLAGAVLMVGISLVVGIAGIFVAVYVTEISVAAALWATLKVLSDRQKRRKAQ
jgi:O-antigen/teichoic acid export membrane protein